MMFEKVDWRRMIRLMIWSIPDIPVLRVRCTVDNNNQYDCKRAIQAIWVTYKAPYKANSDEDIGDSGARQPGDECTLEFGELRKGGDDRDRDRGSYTTH